MACLRALVAASLGISALLAPAHASAQDVGVRAYLSPGPTVGVGRPFVLNVEITGTQSLGEEPELPDLGAFAQYLGSSTQTSMQMVNGRTSVSLTIQYRYQALREGTFDIPAFEVPAGGQTRTTEPLRITVAATPPPQGGGGAQGGGAPDGELVGPNDLLITAEATKSRVRDGEPLVVEYRLWTRVDVSSYNFTRVPEPQGFWVENVTPTGQPQVEQLTRNGQPYTTAVIRRVALVPTGPGERTLEPIGLEAQVRVRRADPFRDPFADFFGRSSLFGSTVVPAAVLSNPLTIAVEPLPPGRPEPFSGIVGALTLTARLDRDSVATNEAVTLTVSARGEGNIRAVPSPSLGLASDFEVFPPEVSESVRPFGPGLSGEKTFEYVLIPRAPGRREIPAITMGYFDLDAGTYRSAATEPLPLTVTGAAVGGPGRVARGGVAQLREDIRFIHLGTDALRPARRLLFDSAAFWILLLLPLACVAGALALRQHRDRLEGDVAYARGRRASRVARKRLAEARTLAATGNARAFYAEVARALRGLVADRLNLAEAGLLTSELGARLGARGVDEAAVAELAACLEHCDKQRFAPPSSDPEEKTRFLERVGELMTSLDRGLRR
jgi:hypothetical protein